MAHFLNDVVTYEKRGQVAVITLNRPTVLNALNIQMHTELAGVWDDFEADEQILVGVLTGAGSKAFSVGQDLKELAQRTSTGARGPSIGSRGQGYPRLTERFGMSKPLVARVNGYAFGGGFELALACDLIIASEHAEFALPEARHGLIPGAGGVFRLLRQIPTKTAMGYLLTGRRITAQRGYDLGFVNEVATSQGLDSAVEGYVADILACAPLSIRAIKQISASSAHLSLPRAFSTRYPSEEQRRISADSREGPLAFAQRRPPIWSGR